MELVGLTRRFGESSGIPPGISSSISSVDVAEERVAFEYVDCFYYFAVVSDASSAVDAIISRLEVDAYGEGDVTFLNHHESVENVFRLAVGLDTDPVGSGSWLLAFENAVSLAGDEGSAGPVFRRIVKEAKAAAALVHSETPLGVGAADRNEAVAELTGKIFGDLSGLKAMILGAGRDVSSLMDVLSRKGMQGFSLPEGETAVSGYSDEVGVIISYDEDSLDSLMKSGDLLEEVGRRSSPLLVIDLSGGMVRPAALKSASNVYFYSSDPLDAVIERNLRVRRGAIPVAEKLLNEPISAFIRWFKSDKWDVSRSIVARSHVMQEVFNMIDRVASTNSTVLITGETGTGKELAARAIHNTSPRADKPFVVVNCGAIPENLLESMLFGHLKGSFTGATADKDGMFRSADGGTIFLDEVGELPLMLQVKLLRVLQDGEIQPVGSERHMKVDVRLIAATNMNLEAAVDEGRFRQDLFYRLNVVEIHLPPLRERPEDVAPLAEHFLEIQRRDMSKRDLEFSEEALDALQACDWRGNVRELQNAVERAAVMTESRLITPAEFPAAVLQPPKTRGEQKPGRESLTEIEERHIREVLERYDYNYSAAAEVLGIGRTTLWRKVKKYGIVAEE